MGNGNSYENKRNTSIMYQLEVKRYLVEHQFPPNLGWDVTVDIDAMELANGGRHPLGKRERAGLARDWLKEAGVEIASHPEFGRADLVARRRRPGTATVIVEVEGESSRQKEQAVYSAFGQIVLLMKPDTNVRYGIAVPDTPSWESQMAKIPAHVRNLLSLTLWLVDETSVRELK